MHNYTWPMKLREVYDRATASYRGGNHSAAKLFNQEDKQFLASIGCTEQELFDFVEDGVRHDEPSFETVLLITAARRDYFLVVQKGERSGKLIDMASLPAKRAKLGDIAWLPRIIEKARAKLRGEMPADLMYCCGGDRGFLESFDIHPADFLRVVWSAGDENGKVLEYVLRNAQRKG